MKQAVVLLSGGLDSATTLYVARDRGYLCNCLILDYGQRHRREVDSARRIAEHAQCPYRIMQVVFPWKGSALLDREIAIPHDRGTEEMAGAIPPTYVPARNTIFLSLAAGWAEAIGAEAVFIGTNAIDYSGYPDCRPEYFDLYNRLLREGTKNGAEGHPVNIETPLIDKTKAEIIRIGLNLNVPFSLTWSCYEGSERPCLKCDSCILRSKGFAEAGLKDPLTGVFYESNREEAGKEA